VEGILLAMFAFISVMIWIDPSTNHADRTKSLLVVLGTGLVMMALMLILEWQMNALEVEVSSAGVQHLAPGKPKTLMWADIVEAKIVPYGKYQRTIRIKTATDRYVFAPHLVPDSPDAPDQRMGFPTYWLYPDAHREPADVWHSFAYKILEEYRPDLLTGKLAKTKA